MESKLIHRKWFLYLTEFFAGMSVMAVELGASRLMAPYFSSSQIVWTVIIGVIMIAMAIGNVWGGKLADQAKSPDRLYRRLIIAAIWIALIPFVGRWLIGGVSLLFAAFVTKNFLVWAALAACLLIFAFPCVLLGTVTPSLTRFTVDNLDDTGKTVGRLNALNTIGSILGTFLPTFVTIPAVGTAATFLLFAGVLAAIGIAYFVVERKKTVPGIVSVLLIVGLCFALPTYSFAFWEKDITLEDESIYNYLQVKEDRNRTILSTNVLFGVQSIQMKSAALTGMYYDYALAAPCMAGMDGTDSAGRSVMISWAWAPAPTPATATATSPAPPSRAPRSTARLRTSPIPTSACPRPWRWRWRTAGPTSPRAISSSTSSWWTPTRTSPFPSSSPAGSSSGRSSAT